MTYPILKNKEKQPNTQHVNEILKNPCIFYLVIYIINFGHGDQKNMSECILYLINEFYVKRLNLHLV